MEASHLSVAPARHQPIRESDSSTRSFHTSSPPQLWAFKLPQVPARISPGTLPTLMLQTHYPTKPTDIGQKVYSRSEKSGYNNNEI